MSINRNLTIFSSYLTSSGAISSSSNVLPAATTTTLGGVKVDGTTITITNGVISSTSPTVISYTLPTATPTTLGGVKVDGTTIAINNGVISLNNSSNYATLNANNTFTNTQTFNGSPAALAAKLVNAKEVVTISATAATGTINFDVSTQSILYYTTNASGNFTINVRSNSYNTLDSVMNIGESISVVFMNTNGGTAYYQSGFQIDSSVITPKWQGGTVPTSGNASAIDVYTYTIIKTASLTYTVLAAQSKFA